MELVLIFRLGGELYGLDVGQVQEIVEAPELDYIPLAGAEYLGAVNFHGQILPVLDLPGHLGFRDRARDPRVIVLPAAVCSLALAVSAVDRIVPLEREGLAPPQGERERETYIREVFSRDGEMVNLLDLQRLLASLEKN